MQGQVLLANGHYKDITSIRPGDYVLNMKMEPVQVQDLVKFPKQPAVQIRHLNWYASSYLHPNEEILTIMNQNGESLLQWRLVANANTKEFLTSEKGMYHNLLPETFDIPLSTSKGIIRLKPSRELGLILGWYCGYGSIVKSSNSDSDCIEFRFGANEELCNYVVESVQKIFGVSSSIQKSEYLYQVIITDEFLVKLFSQFGNKLERQLPHQFWSTDREYNQGIFEGLVDIDPSNNIARFIPLSSQMAEFFVCCCSVLGLTFMNDTPDVKNNTFTAFPLYIVDTQEDSHLGQIIGLKAATEERDMWNIRLDCPTKSFILDNMVVKSL